MLMIRTVNCISVAITLILFALVATEELRFDMMTCLVLTFLVVIFCEWSFHKYDRLSVSFIFKKFLRHNSDLVFQNARVRGLARKSERQ